MKERKLQNYFKAFLELATAFFLSNKLIWDLVNLSARRNFNKRKVLFSNYETSLLEELSTNGFIKEKIDFFDEKILKKIQSFSSSLRPKDSDIKSFLKYKLGGNYGNSNQKFDSLNPLLEFSLNEKLVNLINEYFKMDARLCYLEINETVLSEEINTSNKIKSQNYHKDPGIDKCIKVFIYLNDVDENSGPFVYIKKTHDKFKNYFPQKRYGAGGFYPSNKKINKFINKDLVTNICGAAGTIIIADTTGLHCGGDSYNKKREMATLVYYPPGDLKKSKIKINFNGLKETFPTSSYLLKI